MNNFKYALRLLVKNPGFTLVAVLTLALGIGVNSGIFAIIDAVMLQPLPYPDANRLVAVWETTTGDPPEDWNTNGPGSNSPARMAVSVANLFDYQHNRSFEGVV